MTAIAQKNESVRERYEWNASRYVWTGNSKIPITELSIRLEDGQGITLQKIIRIAALCIFAFAIDLLCMAFDSLKGRIFPTQPSAAPISEASRQSQIPTDRRQILRNSRFFREHVSSEVLAHIVSFLSGSEQIAAFRLKPKEAMDAQALVLSRISLQQVEQFVKHRRKVPAHRITRLDLSRSQKLTAAALRKYCSLFHRVTHLSLPSEEEDMFSRTLLFPLLSMLEHSTPERVNAHLPVSSAEISEITMSLLNRHRDTLEDVTFGENRISGPISEAVLILLANCPNLRGFTSLHSSGAICERAWIALAQKRQLTRFTWETADTMIFSLGTTELPAHLSNAVWSEILQNPLEELRSQNTKLPQGWVRNFSQSLSPQLRLLEGYFDLTPEDLLALSESYHELQVIGLNYTRRGLGALTFNFQPAMFINGQFVYLSPSNADYINAVQQIMLRCTKLKEFEFDKKVNGTEVFELVRCSKSLTTIGMYLRDETDRYGLHLLGNLKSPFVVNAILSGDLAHSGAQILEQYRDHAFIRLVLTTR